MSEQAQPARGYTTSDLAAYFRVSEDKIRGWIIRGEMRACNTATRLSGRPRYVVSPNALAEFERKRSAAPPPKPRRIRKRPLEVDYFPD
jgi:hypothetical protein